MGLRIETFLLIGLPFIALRPLTAQGAMADTVPMTLVIAVFPAQGADHAMTGLQGAPGMGHVESYAVVSKDANSKVKVRSKKKGSGARAAEASNDIDGAVALLGHPLPGAHPGDDSAAYAKGRKRRLSHADAAHIGNMLAPGSSAVILVVDDPYADQMNSALHQANASDVVDAVLVPVGP
jgi:hypothetical protein